MLVSLCVIAYNEENFLTGLFDDILNQTYPSEMIQVVLINSMSTDGTRKLMEDFSLKNKDLFHNITVLDNPKKTQPSGWNTAIKAATGDVIIRVDAHAHIPEEFIFQNIKCLERGEDISGGPRPNIIIDETPWRKTLLLAESSMFGSSIASYRRSSEKKYVNTMFHAAYRKEVFDKAGLFNENLIRTEDNELHYRMRKAGYKFCYDPAITSYQYTRSNFKEMIRQKFKNGFWIGLTAFFCPGCLSLFHFIPLAFIAAILSTTILACLNATVLALIMWSVYWLFNFAVSTAAIIKNKANMYNFALPALFFILHLSYGIGTLCGLFIYPFKSKHLSSDS